MRNLNEYLIILTLLSILHPLSGVRAQTGSRQDQQTIRALQDLKSELDLVVRNQKSTRIDLQRQEREFAWFRVFEAMPFATVAQPVYLERWVRPALENTSRPYGIRIRNLKAMTALSSTQGTPTPAAAPPVPRVARTTDRPDWLKPESIVETVEIDLEGEGSLRGARRWLGLDPDPKNAPNETGPWVEPVRVGSSAPDRWTARVRTYRFRLLNLPMIRSRDPLALLPTGWSRNIAILRKSRPEIADLISEIRGMRPPAEAAYRERAQFMLNGARMSFYIKHGPGWSPRPVPSNPPPRP